MPGKRSRRTDAESMATPPSTGRSVVVALFFCVFVAYKSAIQKNSVTTTDDAYGVSPSLA